MRVPVFSGTAVREAVPPLEAYNAVRDGFVRHARGEWTMQPKVYVANYPAGDFRAMPALGGGHALLKWVTSFPGNPARGLPTVTGLVLLSNAETGELEAVLDAAAVTALRTAAAGVETLWLLTRWEPAAGNAEYVRIVPGSRLGIVIMSTLVGMAFGGWVSGAIFDATGSYLAAFAHGAAWNVINAGIAAFLLMRARGIGGGRLAQRDVAVRTRGRRVCMQVNIVANQRIRPDRLEVALIHGHRGRDGLFGQAQDRNIERLTSQRRMKFFRI